MLSFKKRNINCERIENIKKYDLKEEQNLISSIPNIPQKNEK